MKITIHRALTELKTIDERIQKAIKALVVIGLNQKDKLVNTIYKEDDFNKQAVEDYQSVTALIDRKQAIKSAIVASNAVTKIEVNSKQYTVADAISFKTSIQIKKELVQRLELNFKSAVGQLNKNNEVVNANALALAEKVLQREVKQAPDEANKIMAPYLEAALFKLVDPLEVEKKIKALEEETIKFESDIDAVLSESNAVTFIEI